MNRTGDPKMIVVMRIQDFEFEPINFPLPVSVQTGKLKGYLPVYETLEDAMEEFPGAEYVEVKRKSETCYSAIPVLSSDDL